LLDRVKSAVNDTPLPTEQKKMDKICAEKSNPWNLDAHDLKVMQNFPKDEYENPIYKVVRINPASSKDKSECYRFVADHEKATRLNQERCEARQKYLESLPFFGEPSIIINQDNKKPPFQTLTTIPEENNSINVSHARADGENPLKNPAFKPKKAKGNPKPVKQPHPVTGQWGYEDEKGRWWVPTGNNGSQHGGKHWDVVDKYGNHENVSPEGFIMGTNIPFKCEMPLRKEQTEQLSTAFSLMERLFGSNQSSKNNTSKVTGDSKAINHIRPVFDDQFDFDNYTSTSIYTDEHNNTVVFNHSSEKNDDKSNPTPTSLLLEPHTYWSDNNNNIVIRPSHGINTPPPPSFDVDLDNVKEENDQNDTTSFLEEVATGFLEELDNLDREMNIFDNRDLVRDVQENCSLVKIDEKSEM
ncbi:MAG: hypothetical protein WA364_13170, partial [Candidatus Nitrosopolaris sp.]